MKVKGHKRIILCAVSVLMMLSLAACSRKRATKDWYKETLEYYRQGFASGWKNERADLFVCDEMKSTDYKFGYLLTDLDGDGTDELLIGFDDGEVTKFTDVYIWHSRLGAFRIMASGGGYYVYLCDDNILREDYWYGSQTKTQYLDFNSKNDSFLVVDGGSIPKRSELTEF